MAGPKSPPRRARRRRRPPPALAACRSPAARTRLDRRYRLLRRQRDTGTVRRTRAQSNQSRAIRRPTRPETSPARRRPHRPHADRYGLDFPPSHLPNRRPCASLRAISFPRHAFGHRTAQRRTDRRRTIACARPAPGDVGMTGERTSPKRQSCNKHSSLLHRNKILSGFFKLHFSIVPAASRHLETAPKTP